MTIISESDETFDFEIGMDVDSSDGHWGVIGDIVIGPVKWKVTHLVVQPNHRHHQARLIPVGAVTDCRERLHLALSREEIVSAPRVETTDFIRYEGDKDGSLMWPYYGGSSQAMVATGTGTDRASVQARTPGRRSM